VNNFLKKYKVGDNSVLYELKNGMRVIFTPTLRSQLVYCGFLVNVGSRNENESTNGMAHFIEHSVFKGSHKRHSYQILNRIEAVGGELNAYTTREKTFYYTSTLRKYLHRSVELLVDLIFNPKFPAAELEKEKKVIIEEIEMYEDSPEESIYDDFTARLFHNSSLSHNILGTKKTVNKFTKTDVINYWSAHYIPQNCIFSLVGTITERQVENIIEKYFYNQESKTASISENNMPDYNRFQVQKRKSFQQVHVITGNRALSVHEPRRYALSLVNNILGGDWMSSRLNMNLREKNAYAYNISSGFNTYSDTGSFVIQFGTDSKYLNGCMDIINQELSKMCDEKISPVLLNKAKRQLESQYAFYRENHSYMMQVNARNIADYGKLITRNEYLEAIRKINSSDILAVCNEVFDKNKLSILIYSKEQNMNFSYF